jgi:hypothetical protein
MQGRSGTPCWSRFGWLFEWGIVGHVSDLLYEYVIHVSLLLSQPGQWQREGFYTPTSSVDMLVIVLGAARREIPDWCEGQALSSDNGDSAERGAFAVEAKCNPGYHCLDVGAAAMFYDRYSPFHQLCQEDCHEQYEACDL